MTFYCPQWHSKRIDLCLKEDDEVVDSDLIIFYLKLKKENYEGINDKIIIYNILSNLNEN